MAKRIPLTSHKIGKRRAVRKKAPKYIVSYLINTTVTAVYILIIFIALFVIEHD